MSTQLHAIRRLHWSSDESRPECLVRGCEHRAYWIIRVPMIDRAGRAASRELWRCNVHGREWAERNGLTYPPT